MRKLTGLGIASAIFFAIISFLLSVGVTVAVIWAIIEGIQWLNRH